MNHTKIVKQAWNYALRYRALWLFGIILAITASSWGSAGFYGWDNQDRGLGPINLNIQPGERFVDVLARAIRLEGNQLKSQVADADQQLEALVSEIAKVDVQIDLAAWLWLLAGVAGGILGLFKLAAYFGHVALVRMVDEEQRHGKRFSARQGIRLSWSRATWRLLLLDLTVHVPIYIALALLLALALSLLMLWAKGDVVAGVTGTLVAVAIFLLALLLALPTAACLSLLKPFFRRACILERLGVVASLRRGYALARQHLKDAALTWLIMAGLRIAWPLLMAPLALLLILCASALIGLIGVVASQVVVWSPDALTPILIAVSIGATLFLLIIGTPLLFLAGLREVFLSSMWTMTYRELSVLEPPLKTIPADKLGISVTPAA